MLGEPVKTTATALPSQVYPSRVNGSRSMANTVILYPGLTVSHFVPMVHLAGALLDHGYAVSVALIDPAVNGDPAFRAVVARAVASMPSLRFHTLPPSEDAPTLIAPFIPRYLDIVGRHNDRLRDFLCSFTRGVHAVVVDSLSVEALGVVKRLGIPRYVMFTSGAAALAAFVQLPSVLAEVRRTFQELGDAPLELFGLPPMPASHLLGELLEDPESEIYKAAVTALYGIPEADGILVNTFESLDAGVVAALGDPRCLPGRIMPPVYCVGPFVGGVGSEAKDRHECLTWLDGQPESTVVFLCFGSGGNHSAEQIKEIAVGLENSGHRFLWVVGNPFSDDQDFDALLPNGSLDRTKGRGLVVKQWVPQAEVLHHRATGAFVTHCGWNSVLEGVTAGVPMLCWPLYAEQKMNMLRMVGEMGVAAEMVGWQRGLVEAAEVEGEVRLVMDSEDGMELRARAAAHKEGASVAWSDGGSSRAAIARFLADVDSRQPQTRGDR
ncbi:anthocyanidin 5,3-O-glucosyltransferase-like [Triticum dicoccoides]|uniref:anthocyanidin 5,3-O-glucosyltransferase-like n=1 Tax=Triticum dicoccoides TaxID=85692 RepID=UPI0018902184|nr:anthocyanidin 5,3-O-glucosyltransferase-like [Triticum dicoccoides]